MILPGGESTTQGKLLRSTGLFEPINEHIKAGKPVFGTCAGMILLAQRLENDPNVYFGALDATVGVAARQDSSYGIPSRNHSGYADSRIFSNHMRNNLFALN